MGKPEEKALLLGGSSDPDNADYVEKSQEEGVDIIVEDIQNDDEAKVAEPNSK